MSTKKVHLAHYNFSPKNSVIFHAHSHPLTPAPIFDMHLAPEIGVVLSGRMERHSDGVRQELPRGGVWIAGILESHGRHAIVENSKVAVFIINTEFLFKTIIPGIDRRLWQAPFNTPAKERPALINEEFAEIAERLIRKLEFESDESMQATLAQLTLLELLLNINRLARFNTKDASSVSDYTKLRPAIERIYKSSGPISTPEVAAICGLSESRFSQLFSRATGLSFSKFSLHYRLSQVAIELKTTTKSLDELAKQWSFTDKSHLAHRFKQHYNNTPTSYRALK